MELKLENGRYVYAQQGRLQQVDGLDELGQRIVMKLTARRGGFSAMPEYGSQLYRLGRTKASERESVAARYVMEALADEPDAQLRELSLTEQPDGSALLELSFSVGDEILRLRSALA